jgi:hypothetical protein
MSVGDYRALYEACMPSCKTWFVSSLVLLAACAGEVAAPPTYEEILAHHQKSDAFRDDNTVDGVFRIPQPPSVAGERAYGSCSYTWGETLWWGVIPYGFKFHDVACWNNTGEYCWTIDTFSGESIGPICEPTSCACATEEDDGPSGCGCSGVCGNVCCE